MPTFASVHRICVGICSVAIVAAPIVASAQGPVAREAAPIGTQDVVLGPNGMLSAYVQDENGNPRSNETVSVSFSGAVVATVQTLPDGGFTVEQLREGAHVLRAAGRVWTIRMWQPETAPPTADAGVTLVVPAREVVRVQEPRPTPRRGLLGRAIANYPVLTTAALLGAGIGAGIAIGSGSSSTPATP